MSGSAAEEEEAGKKWGTHVMGAPANPTSHPDNQIAALWRAGDHQQLYFEQQQQQPYLVYSPVEKPPGNPFEAVANMFSTWSRKAETIGHNIWNNLKRGPSVSEAVCGKIGVTAKALTEGGFESLFRQSFETEAEERLKKSFACYLSTTTGPVAGTLYVSTHRVAFCSDRPLSFRAPSGQEAWSYYKVVIPLGRLSTVNPVTQSYIHMVTIDAHEFWFMGFVNFDKALHHLLESLSHFRAAEEAGHSTPSPAH